MNSRGADAASSCVSGSVVSGSINSRQFAQVKLRGDLSVQSHQKRSPNRYAAGGVHASAVDAIHRLGAQQQTIQYNKNEESSLVTENRNRILIGNSLNRAQGKVADTMSVSLNTNLTNKARISSVVSSGAKIPA